MVEYNTPITGEGRLQASLGREFEVYKEMSDSIIMATVVKVNYLYNTVELMTIDHKAMLVAGEEKSGQFSARLPAMFGGSFSTGAVYGQTIPINVGDEVLVGFINSKSNSPIVLGIYKSDSVSYTLAPTNQITGDPESVPLKQAAMEQLTVYPSQVYDWVDGEGNMEKTFNGRSFLKIGSELEGMAKPNDYGFEYDNLQRYHLRGQDIEPVNPILPSILFQHSALFADTRTNVLFDEDENLSISKTGRDVDDKNRAEFRITKDKEVMMRTQSDSSMYDGGADGSATIGISGGTPYMETDETRLEVTDEGVLVNGEPIGTGGGDGNLEELEQKVSELGTTVTRLQYQVTQVTNNDIPGLQIAVDNINTEYGQLKLEVDNLSQIVNGINIDFAPLKEQVSQNTQTITALNLQITNAAGKYASLTDRLDHIETMASKADLIADEVIAARTEHDKDGNVVTNYATLPVRLDDIQQSLHKVIDETKDIAQIRDNVTQLLKDMEQAQKDIVNLNGRVDRIIGSGEDELGTTYIVQVVPDGTTSFKNGEGSVTLDTRLLRNGFYITSSNDLNTLIRWSRQSEDKQGDETWNAQHMTPSAKLKVDADEINGSAKFVATFIKETEAKKLSGYVVVTNIVSAPNVDLAVNSDKLPRQTLDRESGVFTPDFTVSPVTVSGTVVATGGTVVPSDTLGKIEWFLEEGTSYTKIELGNTDFRIDPNNHAKISVYRNINPDLGRFYLWLYVTYTDPRSGVSTELRSDFTFEISTPSSRSTYLDLYSRNGLLFLDKRPDYIILRGEFYSNGVHDVTTSVRYKWFKQDPTVTSEDNPNFDISGGLGWAAIKRNNFPGLEPTLEFNSETKTGTSDLRVTAQAIVNNLEFKLIALSPADILTKYISLSNFDTAYSTSITSTRGLILKGDNSSTDLTAHLFNTKGEIDADGSQMTYRWYVYDADGKLVPGIGENNLDYKEGKTVFVAKGEVKTETFTVMLQVISPDDNS